MCVWGGGETERETERERHRVREKEREGGDHVRRINYKQITKTSKKATTIKRH